MIIRRRRIILLTFVVIWFIFVIYFILDSLNSRSTPEKVSSVTKTRHFVVDVHVWSIYVEDLVVVQGLSKNRI